MLKIRQISDGLVFDRPIKEFLEMAFEYRSKKERLAMLQDIVFAILAHCDDKEFLEDILYILDSDAEIIEERE